jgi:nucleotide-binding universal stress UspA family protein
MKKILVPVDFSEYSEYALEVAASLAKKHDAEIIVYHMMGLNDALLTKDESNQVFEAMYYMKLAEKRFAEFLDKDYLEGVKVTDTVHNYKVFSEVNDLANEMKADFIVMGSHGTSGLSEIFVGSNTEKVVRHSEIPVMVVKEHRPNFEIRDAVFACDFKQENMTAFIKAMNFFDLIGADVKLLYVNLPNEKFRSSGEIETRVREFLMQSGPSGLDRLDDVVYYSDYSVEDGVFHYAEKINADAISLPTHGRRGLAHFFSGSIGEDLVNHAKVPVITFKL